MIPFMHYLTEVRKIKKLDSRYGTSRDPRLNIHSDKAYKESGSGTGIWKAGIGHNPAVFRMKQERPIMTDIEKTKADAANRSR